MVDIFEKITSDSNSWILTPKNLFATSNFLFRQCCAIPEKTEKEKE